MIEKARDILSDRQLELLLTLYEKPTVAAAARQLKMTAANVRHELYDIAVQLEYISPIVERRRKDGQLYKRHLGATALSKILEERDDIEAEDRRIIEVAATSTSQTIAASKMDMSIKEFTARFKQIRDQYNF